MGVRARLRAMPAKHPASPRRLAAKVVERIPAIKQRNDVLRGLMGELEELGKEAAAISADSGEVPRDATGKPDLQVDTARDIGTRILELAARASDVATHAHDA